MQSPTAQVRSPSPADVLVRFGALAVLLAFCSTKVNPVDVQEDA